MSLPGPPLPAAASTLLWMQRPLAYLDACAKRYGEPYAMPLIGFPKIAMFYTPAAVKEVFSDDGSTYAAGKFNKSLSALLGERSVLMLDGAEHMRHRKLLLPPFHGERMQRYGQAMLDATDACIEGWTPGKRFALQPDMQDVTLRVILQTIFGFALGPRLDEMRRRTKRILQLGAWPPLLLPFMQRDLGPWSPWAKFQAALKAGDEYLYDEIARRRRSGERSHDILSLLLDARDEDGQPMSDADLRDELTTLLVAGHETTATALTWAVRWTLATPGLLDRVRAEIHAARSKDGTPRLTAARAAELPLIDAIAREAMRLNPVIPIVGRVLERPVRLAGHDLPAGTPLACSIYLAQRRPDVYPNPSRFDPDRFLGKKPAPSEFFPFGGGVRRCIGMAFALYEMRIVLARLFERAELSLAPDAPIRVERRSITLVPSAGLLVRLERRLPDGVVAPPITEHAAGA
ncbi:MAG: cytochrome P450 [Labilithrix sp.]|nr:cytochrome P450 [Labilithrix sp.]